MTDLEVRDERREAIFSLQDALLSMPQQECPVAHHHFHKGYAREMFIPAGTMLVGKIHKHQTLNILLQGDISLLTEDGSSRVKAPFMVVSQPGIKRVGFAHTNCTWLTVHGTEETDLEKIEEEVIAKDYDEVALTEEQKKQLEQIKKESLCLG